MLTGKWYEEYAPMGLGPRFVTILGDLIIFGLLYLIFLKFLLPYLGRTMGHSTYEIADMRKCFPFGPLFVGFYMAFQLSDWQAPFCLHYAGGKIIAPDGSKPGFKEILIRNVPLIILCMAPTMIMAKGFYTLLFLVWSVFSILSLLSGCSAQGQGWHDRIAKCIVVRKRLPTDFETLQARSRQVQPVMSGTMSTDYIPDQNRINRLVYDAKDRELFGIWIINLLLKMVTLGVYTFWGKVRLRRYITGSFTLLDDRFEYTGTGGELFRGFLKALPIIMALYAPFIIWPSKTHPAVNLLFLPILFLIYAGTYTALRYKFSRTTWRGIRGRITGSALKYASLKMGQGGLNALTLGIAIPYSDINLQKYRIEHSYFGSTKAVFTGKASALMRVHIITLLLVIPTLGLSRFWYRAALARYIYESTTFNTLRFAGTQTGGNMLGLFAGNLLLAIITIGLGMPIIMQRNMQYITTSGIHQSTEPLGTSGEGIYGLLGDMDIGFL